jgi:hypothetical protein
MTYPDTAKDILYWEYKNEVLDVTAELSEFALDQPATYWDPPEFGSAIASISIDLGDDLDNPPTDVIETSDDVLSILTELDPDSWIVSNQAL